MKKIILLLTFGLFLSLFIGCEKDPNPGPEPVKLTATVEPTADTTVPVGHTVTFDVNTNAQSVRIFSKNKDTTLFNPGNFYYQVFVDSLGRKDICFRFSLTGFDTRQINRTVFGVESPPPPEAPMILLLDSVRVIYGTSYNIALVIQNAISASSDIPGFEGILGGIFPTAPLTNDTVFHVSASNEVGTTVDSIIIFVDPPLPPTNLELITAHPWRITTFLYKCDEDDTWTFATLSQEWLDEVNFFYTNYTRVTYRYGVRIGSGPYMITQDSLFWGNGPYKIITLNDTVMVIKHLIPSTACPSGLVISQKTYVPTQK